MEAAKFEERGILMAADKGNAGAREYQWFRTREKLFRALQKHYGPRFPDAMMRIRAWIETEETWHKDPNHPDGWEYWPYDKRPLVLYLRVEVR